MPPIRVLVVDDSVVVRRLVADALASEPRIEVVGTAANGRVALAKIDQLNPELITLDIEMPDMDGLQTLSELRARRSRIPVIMFSTLTERGAATTLEALERGARDYVTKPANLGSVAESIAAVRDQLVPKVLALVPRAKPARRPIAAAAPIRPTLALNVGRERPDVVAIGISTGGPDALANLLPRLAADFPVPIVIVQHMPPIFTQHLAARLDRQSPLTITEAVAGDAVVPGRVLIAPGDFHLRFRRLANGDVVTVVDQSTPENYCRPAVDVMFRSVAETWGARALGVVMTGMGVDGAAGAERLAAVGAATIIQDEATSVVWGMPGAVAARGVAAEALPLTGLAAAITTRVQPGSRMTSLPVHHHTKVAR